MIADETPELELLLRGKVHEFYAGLPHFQRTDAETVDYFKIRNGFNIHFVEEKTETGDDDFELSGRSGGVIIVDISKRQAAHADIFDLAELVPSGYENGKGAFFGLITLGAPAVRKGSAIAGLESFVSSTFRLRSSVRHPTCSLVPVLRMSTFRLH